MASFLFVSKDCFHPISYHCLPKKKSEYLTCIYSSIVNISLILYGGVICVYFLLCCFFVYFFDKACQFLFYLCILLLHVKLLKRPSKRMNSCHFKFYSKYCRQSAYSQTLLQVFALCRSIKNQ